MSLATYGILTEQSCVSDYGARHFFELKSDKVKPGADYFFVKCDYRYEKIHFREILYVEGMENYIVIWTTTQK